MSKKSLIVLSICMLLGAGIVAYVWASGCCGGDPGEPPCICHGSDQQVGSSCDWTFSVDHSRECGTDHDVYVHVSADGGPYSAFLMTPQSVYPYPICMLYQETLPLNANTTYDYYFGCPECDYETCCAGFFNTGNCGE